MTTTTELMSPHLPAALAGVWMDSTRGHLTWERWWTLDDSTMEGMGCVVDGTDTVFLEHLRMEQRNGALVYLARVDQQHHGEWVLFKGVGGSPDSLQFENTSNDFPQCISYLLANDSTWNVTVSGMDHGTERVVRYRFVRLEK